MHIAKKIVSKLRDPYALMNEEQLRDVLSKTEMDLKKALDTKQFKECERLQSQLEHIQKLVKGNVIQLASPKLSKEELDISYLATKFEMDHALQTKNFSRCQELQGKLDSLEQEKAAFPSFNNLTSLLKVAEKKLAEALSAKHFRECEDFNKEIEALKKQLESVLPEDNIYLVPYNEEKANLQERQNKAMKANDFKACAAIQDQLERLELKLASAPSDIDAKLKEIADNIVTAASKQDFQLQAKLSIDYDLLKQVQAWLPKPKSPEDCPVVPSPTDLNPLPKPVETELTISAEPQPTTSAIPPPQPSLQVTNLSAEDKVSFLPSKAKHKDEDTNLASSQQLRTMKPNGKAQLVNSVPIVSQATAPIQETKPQAKPFTQDIHALTKATTQEPTLQMTVSTAPSVGLETSIRAGTHIKSDNARPRGSRTVAQLLPSTPLLLSTSISVAEACYKMSSHRTDIALLSSDQGFEGIVTAKLITERLVSKGLPAESTQVSKIMNSEFNFVRADDCAIETLSMMVRSHRKLVPVVDAHGLPVGVLHIGKCLYDALRRLEKKQKKMEVSENTASLENALRGVKGLTSEKLKLLQNFLKTVADDSSTPNLGKLLEGKPVHTCVSPEMSIEAAAVEMSKLKTPVLVVDYGELVGILTYKDVLNRVLSQNKDPGKTAVREVMTEDPESFVPETELLEALHHINENKYIHLPVVTSEKEVLGMVDIMDILEASMSGAGAEGWSGLIDDDGENSFSETASIGSVRTNKSINQKFTKSQPENNTNQNNLPVNIRDNRPVRKLRPKPPLLAESSTLLLHIAQEMTNKRTDAALLVQNNTLAGIVTSNDLVRAVAKGVDFSDTLASSVMTPNPRYVNMDDSALDALALMVENGFRHLPVVDEANGILAGLLDISKCLYDALGRMEALKQANSLQNKSGGTPEKHRRVPSKSGSNNFKGGFEMIKVFGEKNPTLKELITKRSRSAFVRPTSTIQEAASKMMQGHCAVLVVEDGRLRGILTAGDILNRVISNELDPENTVVEVVMTENPDSFLPSMDLVDALYQMHGLKFHHIPVVSSTGEAIGIVDVKDILKATMDGSSGQEGWRSLFDASLDADDMSDAASMRSIESMSRNSPKNPGKRACLDSRPVSKLHPKVPVIAPKQTRVTDLAKAMAAQRTDAALLTDSNGSLAGILTDTDVLRRVVARGLNPKTVAAASAMTSSPRCVHQDSGALDALEIMVENRFRHLPVVDENESIVGVLDIAKCLYDAVSKMERIENSSTDKAGAELQAVKDAMKKVKNVDVAKRLMQSVQDMFSGGIPTLQDVIDKKSVQEFFPPDSGILEVAESMSRTRSAVLIVQKERLVGILTPKDILFRMVAKELEPSRLVTSSIMTPNPDHFPPEMSLLDAMHQMRDHKYLHLPVVAASGKVLGIVGVMDVVAETMGNSNTGQEGWRSFFGATMDLAGEGFSDSSSVRSGQSRHSQRSLQSTFSSKEDRKVSRLRPRAPVTASQSEPIGNVAKRMTQNRSDVALLIDSNGGLAGIFTANDVVGRVVSQELPVTVAVERVMTPRPRTVTVDDSAIEALTIMAENHFQHLPVVDHDHIVGILDIAKCLYDAITRLEKVEKESELEMENAVRQLETTVKQMKSKSDSKMMLASVMKKAFGASIPSVSDIIKQQGQRQIFVQSSTLVFEAAVKMAHHKSGVLVVDRGKLSGILTRKDILNRVVSAGLDPKKVTVKSVMTPNPEAFPPDLTLVDALHQMHELKYLHLPIVDEKGQPKGIVDVMDLVGAALGTSFGSAGFGQFFRASIDRDVSETSSTSSRGSSLSLRLAKKQESRMPNTCKTRSKLRLIKPFVVAPNITVRQACSLMFQKRTNALLIGHNEKLLGIFTDKDLVCKVVAKYLESDDTLIEQIMTESPTYKYVNESALDSLSVLVKSKLTHLPLVDDKERVVGILDSARIVQEAILVLEHVQKLSAQRSVKDVVTYHGYACVRPTDNVREAAIQMLETSHSVLVVDEDELVGVLTPNIIIQKVFAGQLALDLTTVDSVMQEKPKTINPSHTLLEALHVMDTTKCQELPVVDNYGNILGLISFLDVLQASFEDNNGYQNWETVIDSEWNAEIIPPDDFVHNDVYSNGEGDEEAVFPLKSFKLKNTTDFGKNTLLYGETSSITHESEHSQDVHGFAVHDHPEELTFVYKFADTEGNMHRITSSANDLSVLRQAVSAKIHVDSSLLVLKYVDNEGDDVTITCAKSLCDAIDHAKMSSAQALKLKISTSAGHSSKLSNMCVLPASADVKDLSKVSVPQNSSTAQQTSSKTITLQSDEEEIKKQQSQNKNIFQVGSHSVSISTGTSVAVIIATLAVGAIAFLARNKNK